MPETVGWKILRTIAPVANDTDVWVNPATPPAAAIVATVPSNRPDSEDPVAGVQIGMYFLNAAGAVIDPGTFTCTVQFFEIVNPPDLPHLQMVFRSDALASVDGNDKVTATDLVGPTKFTVAITSTANIPGTAASMVIRWREL